MNKLLKFLAKSLLLVLSNKFLKISSSLISSEFLSKSFLNISTLVIITSNSCIISAADILNSFLILSKNSFNKSINDSNLVLNFFLFS